MSTPTLAADLRALLAILNDRQPHTSAALRERIGYVTSATFNRRLTDLRRLGHDVRKVTDRRDYQRLVRVVEYQMF